MKTFSLVASLFVAGLPGLASAAGSESLVSGADAAFARLAAFKPAFQMSRLEARQGKTDLPRSAAAARKYIRLSGYVSLSGSQYVTPGTAFAYVTVSGYTNLQDGDGHYLGQVQVSDWASFNIAGNSANGWARPRADVSIYDNGKYLGTVHVEGSIFVSGFANGGWLNLNGSGYVNGQGYIDDPAPAPKP